MRKKAPLPSTNTVRMPSAKSAAEQMIEHLKAHSPSAYFTLAYLATHPKTKSTVAKYSKKYGVTFASVHASLENLRDSNMGGGFSKEDIDELICKVNKILS
jgi:aspartate aminotransferase-like enzyme